MGVRMPPHAPRPTSSPTHTPASSSSSHAAAGALLPSARRGPSPQHAAGNNPHPPPLPPRVLTRPALSAWPGARQAGVQARGRTPAANTHRAPSCRGRGCRGGVPQLSEEATNANRSGLGKVRPSWMQEHADAAAPAAKHSGCLSSHAQGQVQGCQGMPGRVGDQQCACVGGGAEGVQGAWVNLGPHLEHTCRPGGTSQHATRTWWSAGGLEPPPGVAVPPRAPTSTLRWAQRNSTHT